MVEKSCNVCNKHILVPNWKIISGRGKYCSRKCQFIGLQIRVLRKCSICGKDVFYKKSVSKKRQRCYCSHQCRTIGYKKYDFKRVVNYIKKNSGYEKQKLGKKGLAISYDGYYYYNNKKVHRIIMENHIGRKLLSSEIVHHINEDKLDNRISNLQIVSRSEHNRIHNFLHK